LRNWLFDNKNAQGSEKMNHFLLSFICFAGTFLFSLVIPIIWPAHIESFSFEAWSVLSFVVSMAIGFIVFIGSEKDTYSFYSRKNETEVKK
jgi:hypothetical protein